MGGSEAVLVPIASSIAGSATSKLMSGGSGSIPPSSSSPMLGNTQDVQYKSPYINTKPQGYDPGYNNQAGNISPFPPEVQGYAGMLANYLKGGR